VLIEKIREMKRNHTEVGKTWGIQNKKTRNLAMKKVIIKKDDRRSKSLKKQPDWQKRREGVAG